jgi:predicted acetyltransferase
MSEVTVKAATADQKPVLQWLLELHVSEFTQMKGGPVVQKQVFFDQEYLDLFWRRPDWIPLLIHYHNKVAGFALVFTNGFLREQPGVHVLSDFFILKKYRKQGIGRTAALMIFERFPGKWEVLESDFNKGGQAFWRSVVSDYTGGRYTESTLSEARWQGLVQAFDNSRPAGKGSSARLMAR